MDILEKAYEESYAVVMSVDGTNSVQSEYNINHTYKKEKIFIGARLYTPYASHPAKLTDVFVSDNIKTVFLAFTGSLRMEKEKRKSFIEGIANGKKLRVVDERLIEKNHGIFKNGDIVEVRDISEQDEGKIEICEKQKKYSILMYESKGAWEAFEVVE